MNNDVVASRLLERGPDLWDHHVVTKGVLGRFGCEAQLKADFNPLRLACAMHACPQRLRPLLAARDSGRLFAHLGRRLPAHLHLHAAPPHEQRQHNFQRAAAHAGVSNHGAIQTGECMYTAKP